MLYTKTNAMKTISLSIFVFLLSFVFFNASGQDVRGALVTDSFKVSGNCQMCKQRIEKALKVPFVKDVLWNKESHMLYVLYNPSKIKLADLHAKIAAVGHDTELLKADDKVYSKLPQCCKYRE